MPIEARQVSTSTVVVLLGSCLFQQNASAHLGKLLPRLGHLFELLPMREHRLRWTQREWVTREDTNWVPGALSYRTGLSGIANNCSLRRTRTCFLGSPGSPSNRQNWALHGTKPRDLQLGSSTPKGYRFEHNNTAEWLLGEWNMGGSYAALTRHASNTA
jgi:hypothetical protein